jgi:diguanylate cyclase (GGDEF)-like protein
MTTVLWAMVLLIAHNRRMTQRAELAARRLALTDPLTGVANLRTFNEEFQRELDRAQADGKPLGVAFVDLNGLKATNTVHGHAGGDRLICGTAEALLSVSGEGDQVARVGGDEFAVLVPGGTSGQMKELESRFAVALSEQSLNGQRGPLELSASIGSAVHPQDGATADQLMQVADRRMYDSKAALPSRFPTPGTAGGRALSEQPIEGSSSSATMIASGAPAASLAWLLAAAMIATGAASTGAADVHPRFAFLLTGVCFVVAGVLAFTHDARRQRASNIANGLAVGIAIPAIWATGGAAAPILPLAYLVVANAAYALSPRAAVLQTGAMMGILVAVLISNVETAHAAGASVILGEVLVIAALLRFNRMRADAAEHEALELSRIDPLTRLANRRVFERSLAVASQERISRGTQEHDRGGLILIDVDNFKTINSSGGHRTGDEVLRMIAAVLEGAAGSDALVCRIGGDEFAVVVPEGDQSSLLRLAAKCRAAIGAVDWHVLCEPEVTISAGVASWELVDDWKEIVVAADLAMRLSKDSGRNAVSAAPERPVETHRPAADAV